MDKDLTTYHIVQRDTPTMYFIGVTTAQSAMMRLFPLWAEILGLDGAQLIGVDLPLQADPEQYRQAVAQIKYDPLSLGALITTHKIDLFDAAADLLDELDSYAQLCHEVACIEKRNNQLIGSAKDAVTSRQALQTILGP
ncbi:MAG: shikimate dehydrogenase, partial [Chloroflexi bacterium]|nr:shikimate dehydrogenase [Chloroflexota bacterium]